MRLISGSGPAGPSFHGVWQSLHPATVTRYLPRASLSASRSSANSRMGSERRSGERKQGKRSRALRQGRSIHGSTPLVCGDFSAIQRSSSASASASRSCVPSGGICVCGLRELHPRDEHARVRTARSDQRRVVAQAMTAKAAARVDHRAQHAFCAGGARSHALRERQIDRRGRAIVVVAVRAIAMQVTERRALSG